MKRRKSVHRNDLQTETDITGGHPTICHKLLTVLNLLCGKGERGAEGIEAFLGHVGQPLSFLYQLRAWDTIFSFSRKPGASANM